ncbi:DUF6246 family protein [Actinobacillus pleuropneumoniae]|uniref:DUF6246 family protein n=1 Tax=Actinobacillus pleuropneumoniae TaxID=715 RepID=UPI0001E49C84|nr:DUF6246 family protein [Actinobacillus pleuropneumoniae]EFN03430.1 hypothetical protein appser13_5050 [Actinobacillus pleuropneumoniae serovar 13 str. N273]KIE87659.1 hypothetical protein AP1022_02530 [Actinobacillus pleuropneumoniae]KIE92242.1 hypothetical protein AP518_00613 [Actinobacillus pleuropneumoniae]KIE97477.1 hypothetical protein AP5651_00616 [Actinobacillus pleuropneumoniae]KIE99134.1 hypothetical protein AP780_00735 [Actinobacillus pleuropneumoniae]
MQQPILEIGEIVITHNGVDYWFKPTLKNIYKIGNPSEIVEIYGIVNLQNILDYAEAIKDKSLFHQAYFLSVLRSPVFGRRILLEAMNVVQACCDMDCTDLIGNFTPTAKGVRYKSGALSPKVIIAIARRLLEHGVIGCCKLDLNQEGENKSNNDDYSPEFNVIEYISLARTMFGISREEAESLTMTELQEMIKSKIPKKQAPKAVFSESEYDELMRAYEERKG